MVADRPVKARRAVIRDPRSSIALIDMKLAEVKIVLLMNFHVAKMNEAIRRFLTLISFVLVMSFVVTLIMPQVRSPAVPDSLAACLIKWRHA